MPETLHALHVHFGANVLHRHQSPRLERNGRGQQFLSLIGYDDPSFRSLMHSLPAEKIGIIGLGLLGSAIAKRLISAGFGVYGFDISEDCRARLGTLGGETANSATEVAAACRYIICSLPDSGVVGAVFDEIETKLSDGTWLLDTTTGDPNETVRCGARLAERGHFYLDATIGGSSKQVEAGEAIVIVGGDEGAFQAAPSYCARSESVCITSVRAAAGSA